ncbi:hypothetical protein E2L08_04470 [Palleronia sediminis]|uniref:Uncharacterized protein n=1 Tax=Palleronia sediminis TaxID=2547833 RepID=A0A4R6AFM9_9RHOB|nr:hypothetical protein [Palleronia sediminis]TDL81912.1 hypothetical protein E2L08_04470 [Palleronia sediminis]
MRVLLILGIALAGCSAADLDRLTRDAARSVLSRALLAEYPALALEPALDCAMQTATTREIDALAGDAVTGPDEAARQTLATIMSRPAMGDCLTQRGVATPAPASYRT